MSRRQWREVWDPRRSLRARLAMTFGLLVFSLTVGLVISLEFTAVNEALNPNALIDRLVQQIWVSGLLLTLAFVVVSWLIAGRIARPLTLMADTARDLFAQRDVRVIPTFPGQDEVASLSRSLNILVATLETQQKALREANTQLEQHVAERTHQLDTLYDVLEITSQIEELPILLARVLSRLLVVSRGECGFVHLMDAERQELVLVAQAVGGETAVSAQTTIPLELPGLPAILETIEGSRTPVSSVSPILILNSDIGHEAFAWHLPILKGSQCLGLITICQAESNVLNDDDQAMIRLIASQLGNTIESDRLRRQAEQLAVVNERNRLARDLHDSVTQSLYSAALFAEAGQKQAKLGNGEKALAYLDDVLDTSRQALKEMRLLVYKLRPSHLQHAGLHKALDQRLKAVEHRAGIDASLVIPDSLKLPARLEETLYHIGVEALNNSLKHAKATAVTITVTQTETAVTLQVADNGRGFDPDTAAAGGGYGLTTMQERAAQQGGQVTITSAPNGTCVTAVLPCTQAAQTNQGNPVDE